MIFDRFIKSNKSSLLKPAVWQEQTSLKKSLPDPDNNKAYTFNFKATNSLDAKWEI